MASDDSKQRLLTALTAEHFAMQGALANAVSEGNSRSSMYLAVLSGSIVAMGFATQVEAMFLPFVATVLPAVFVMGVLTVLRLIDVSIESSMAEISIARIRRYYRGLGGEAESLFDARMGRWPESAPNPALRFGAFVGYWTSAAAMIAAINALVAAAATTLILHLGLGVNLVVAIAAGAILALALLFGFHQIQKLRISEADRYAEEVGGITPSDN
jgi:hypothetical protein